MRFFLRPPSKVTNFNTSPMPPPFKNFSLDTLNSEQKLSVKKPVDRAVQKPVDRPVNRRWFWCLPVGSGRENPDCFHLWCAYQILVVASSYCYTHLCLSEWLLTTLRRCKKLVALHPVKKFFGIEVWNGIRKKVLVWNGIWNGRFLVWNGNGMEENC